MQTSVTRPGVLPSVLLHSSPWNAEAVRKVSFEDPTWRAILVSDETGPVGALCYSEPSIHAQITVDTVVMHPERAASAEQIRGVLDVCLPILRTVAERFRAKRIVFEAMLPALREVLAGYGAREDSVTLSISATDALTVTVAELPKAAELSVQSPEYAAKCGRPCASQAGKAAHERHCQNCKEA